MPSWCIKAKLLVGGLIDFPVRSLGVINDEAGGLFSAGTFQGGVDSRTTSGEVRALAVDGDTPAVGGSFLRVNADFVKVSAENVAVWNGTKWISPAGGVNDAVEAVSFSGANLFATGRFSYAGNTGQANGTGTRVNAIARWDGARWMSLGFGLQGNFNGEAANIVGQGRGLLVEGDEVLVTGDFLKVEGAALPPIAVWKQSP